jgi:signal recognition particle subunit SRP54
MQEKILSAKFDFDDFLKQTRLMKNMGSLGGIMKLIPGMAGKISDDQLREGETQLKRVEAMIKSMTLKERRNPELLSGSPSRRRRIATGSGYKEKDVSKLVSDFQKMRSLMQQMGSGQMGMPGMGGGFPGMGGGFPGMGGGSLAWAADPSPVIAAIPVWAAARKRKRAKRKRALGNCDRCHRCYRLIDCNAWECYS